MKITPRKSLGQNFLEDRNIQRKIFAACSIKAGDTVLEIGAGRGEITQYLLAVARLVWAVELDERLCHILSERFKTQANLKIIRQDILRLKISDCCKGLERKIKVVGNIPYYISSRVIEHLFKYHKQISDAYLSVQQEFARRMGASAGGKEYGALSCFVQYYALPEILFTIKGSCFFPRPNVDSAFVHLRIKRAEELLPPEKEELLFKVIRKAFGQRRKQLKNSLKGLIPTRQLDAFSALSGRDPHSRPEELSLQDFILLTDMQLGR